MPLSYQAALGEGLCNSAVPTLKDYGDRKQFFYDNFIDESNGKTIR